MYLSDLRQPHPLRLLFACQKRAVDPVRCHAQMIGREVRMAACPA